VCDNYGRGKDRRPSQPSPPYDLSQHPVDCLLIEECRIEIWSLWISSAPLRKQPETILFFTEAKHLGRESGAVSKPHRKHMEKLGYSIRFWLMEACNFGAAVAQLRLGAMYTRDAFEGKEGPTQPTPNHLPARLMRNLWMPFGVPSMAWTKMVPNSPGTG
jgi:hypothetical protein